MKKIVLAVLLTVWGLSTNSWAADPPAKPATANANTAKACILCHKANTNEFFAFFDNVAMKTKTIQIKLDDKAQLLNFDKATLKVLGADRKTYDADYLRKIKKGHEVHVEFEIKDDVKVALKVIEKPAVSIPAEMLITGPEIEKLVAMGSKKGKYHLYDSRPGIKFQESSIPTSQSMPFQDFDKLADKLLPKDKNSLIIFYCGGLACSLSPSSANKAKALGYTNIKVYTAGMPEWSKRNYGVVSAKSLKEAWFDKDVPHVLLDARPHRDDTNGFIKGSVCFPANNAENLIKYLPPKEKKPPIIVFDAKSGKDSEKVAKALLKAGYGNVNVLEGGFDAWNSAGYSTLKVEYVPKPRPGEIALDEFKRYASALPPNVMIIDVRNPDETQAGHLKTAALIPSDDIRKRIAEIPKDKLIVTHCATGVRAEMAYHLLKELGYNNVKFVNAAFEFNKDGSYEINKD